VGNESWNRYVLDGCRKQEVWEQRWRRGVNCSRVCCRQQDQYYYDVLIGSRVRAFDWCQNQWPWITFERPKRHSCRNEKKYGAHQKRFERSCIHVISGKNV